MFTLLHHVLLFIFLSHPVSSLVNFCNQISFTRQITSPSRLHAVKVWIEPAEDDFVDEENLMTGETCLRAVKAYASSSSSSSISSSIHDDDNETSSHKLFLCAGALVQRPNTQICDAWLADCLIDETNLQLQGALLILDDLFEFHLNTQNRGYMSFLVQSGSLDSEYHCASYMAATLRGFRPLKELSRDAKLFNKSVQPENFVLEEEHPDALMFDSSRGLEIYMSKSVQSNSPKASSIAKFLPKEINEI